MVDLIHWDGKPITAPGLYAATEADYHSDALCPTPSLSRSIGQMLIDQSPRHAWTAHPRLNPDFEQGDKNNERRTDIGSAAHALLLKQPVEIEVIDAEKYTKKADQEARKAAYERGAIPLLKPDHKIVLNMIERARAELSGNELAVIRALVDDSVDAGTAYNEVTACWQDRLSGHWCRTRMDRLVVAPKRITILDYKTTEMSASPEDVQKAIFNNCYELQDGFYRRGMRHIVPEIDRHEVKLDFLFIVQEQKPPHEITVARIDLNGQQIGEKKASTAVRLWDRHITSGEWPGYPNTIKQAEMPAYVETRWLSREIEDERLQDMPADPLSPFTQIPYTPKKIAEAC